MKKLPFFEAIALLVGTVVGAGFLGIPYVVSRVGFPLGLVLILGIGLLLLIQFLAVAEISLRTQGKHQITGYVERYLGRRWRPVILTLVILEIYGALLAYIVGEGQVLSAVFGGSSFLFSYIFFFVMAVVVFFDLKLVEKVDLLLTLMMIGAVVAIAFGSWSEIRFEHFLDWRPEQLLPAYGVILFSFLGVGAIPEMRLALKGRERMLPKAVLIGGLIPVGIYLLFTMATLGVTGADTTQIATIGLGEALGRSMVIVGNVLAMITMSTAFLGLSLALKETFWFDLKFSRNQAWLLTIIVPIIFFSFGLHSFIKILLFVGAIFGGLQGIILMLTHWKARRRGDRHPEFTLPYRKFFGWLLALVFGLGVIYAIINL